MFLCRSQRPALCKSGMQRIAGVRAGCAATLSVALAGVLTACGGFSSPSSSATSRAPTTETPDERADALLARMTQAQKLQIVQGAVTTNSTIVPPLPRGGEGWIT